MSINEAKTSFSEWIMDVTENIPEDVTTLIFNLYEDDSEYLVDISGTTEFDEFSEDWIDSEVWTSGEVMFILPKEDGFDWEEALDTVASTIEEVVEENIEVADILESYNATIGFIDGDLEILWTLDDIEE